MTVYFTSDTHFNHANIIKYCNRPWPSIEAMNQGIMANINSVVRPGDTLIHIGDFAMGQKVNRYGFVKDINCDIILIRGNHDNVPKSTLLGAGFKEVHESYVHTDQVYGEIWCEHVPNLQHGKAWHFCGHVHEKWLYHNPNIINVGVDVHDFKPKSAADIIYACAQANSTKRIEEKIVDGNSITDAMDRMIGLI